jgi:hypothetical protein
LPSRTILERPRDTHTAYNNGDAYLHHDASASRWLLTFVGHGRSLRGLPRARWSAAAEVDPSRGNVNRTGPIAILDRSYEPEAR